MAITWADVTAIAPDLSAVSSAGQTAILAYVEDEVNVDAWGARANRGKAYLAAHLGTLDLRGGSGAGGGAVTSETIGPLSRTYAHPSVGSDSLGLTSYGAEYMRLVKLLPVSIGMVI